MGSARSTYDGPKRKLILAFDVGTTYSGVSYTCVQLHLPSLALADLRPKLEFCRILTPDQVPEIRGVTRFVGQIMCGQVESDELHETGSLRRSMLVEIVRFRL
jgi:hypothetical protein